MAEDVEEKQEDELATCSSCAKSIPPPNLALHELTCRRKRQQAQKDFPSKTVEKVKKGSNKKGASSPKQKSLPKNDEESEDNLDELLAEFTVKDSQCALPGCKKSISTVGQKCRCCTNTYCFGHHIPEVHGCSQAAKEHARRDMRTKASGNHKKTSAKTVTNRAHLHRKLENRLKNLEGKRKPITTQDGKK